MKLHIIYTHAMNIHTRQRLELRNYRSIDRIDAWLMKAIKNWSTANESK